MKKDNLSGKYANFMNRRFKMEYDTAIEEFREDMQRYGCDEFYRGRRYIIEQNWRLQEALTMLYCLDFIGRSDLEFMSKETVKQKDFFLSEFEEYIGSYRPDLLDDEEDLI